MEQDFPKHRAKARRDHGRGDTSPDYDSFISYPLMNRVEDIDQLAELLDTLNTLPEPDQTTCLRAFAGVRGKSSLIIDRVWLAELARKEQCWDYLVAQLRRLLDLAIRLGIKPFAMAVAPSLVRIIDKNLDDGAAAATEAEARAATLGEDAD